LPDPVGAAISTLRASRISGQARACAGVGALKHCRNQLETTGWKAADMRHFRTPYGRWRRLAETRVAAVDLREPLR
jgi:hypothetical protein